MESPQWKPLPVIAPSPPNGGAVPRLQQILGTRRALFGLPVHVNAR
jgi:hypothetical protein